MCGLHGNKIIVKWESNSPVRGNEWKSINYGKMMRTTVMQEKRAETKGEVEVVQRCCVQPKPHNPAEREQTRVSQHLCESWHDAWLWHWARDGIAQQGVRPDPEKLDSSLTPCSRGSIPLPRVSHEKNLRRFLVQGERNKRGKQGRERQGDILIDTTWSTMGRLGACFCVRGGGERLEGVLTVDRHSE